MFIFDGECPFCRRVAWLARRLDFETKAIQSSQEFLREVLGENFPFALYLITENTEGLEIAWGSEAVVSMLRKIGLGPLSFLGYLIYPVLRKLNQRAEKINKEKGICGCMLSGRKLIRKKETVPLLF